MQKQDVDDWISLDALFPDFFALRRPLTLFFFSVCRSANRANEQKSNLMNIRLRIISSALAILFARFLGSEGTAIMTTGRNLVLFGMLILGFIFLYRHYCFRLKKKYGFRLVFLMYLSILFFVSFFCYFLRVYLVYHFGIHLSAVFSFFILSGGALPLPAPSGPSNSGNTPVDWDSFDERVLLEPMPDSSSSSVNGPPNTEAAGSSQTSVDQDPEELRRTKEELHLLVREQLRHYCERGRPKWKLSHSEEALNLYSECAKDIIKTLEIEPTVSDHRTWITQLMENPETLKDLYKPYK